jgi:hypothetical protein
MLSAKHFDCCTHARVYGYTPTCSATHAARIQHARKGVWLHTCMHATNAARASLQRRRRRTESRHRLTPPRMLATVAPTRSGSRTPHAARWRGCRRHDAHAAAAAAGRA